jgi:signal transduction histidine kinase
LLTGSLFGSRLDPGRGRRPAEARRDVGGSRGAGRRAVEHHGVHGLGALEDVRAALRAVLDIGAEALAGLRSVEAVLAMRGEEMPSTRSATSGLGDLTVLAERWAGVGLLVRAAGNPGFLPPVIDQAAYRVVQEALANVAQHSCALHADIALHRDGEQFTVVISDPGPPRASCMPAAGDPQRFAFGPESAASDREASCGRGLNRMRERVEALGGAFCAGMDGVGWCVHVVFPAGPVG